MAPHLPVFGEYFVFKLNPTQTLNLILDDPEVAKECEALGARCKKYIGCCINWTGIPVEGTLFPFEMSMVSRGLVAYPKNYVTQDMSIPILPTTHHPRRRKPLVVDPPLPWDNCYHATTATMIVRVLYREPDFRPRGKYALMPHYQTSILEFQKTDDDQWRQKLLYMDETGGSDFEPPPIEDQEGIEEFYESLKAELDPSQLPEHERPYALRPEATDSLADITSLEGSDHYDSDGTDSASRVTSYDSQRERRAHQYDYSPVLDLTVDLETVPVDELADNLFGFYEELLEMGEILLAHQARVAAAVAEVQRQDAEFDAKVAAARHSSSSTGDSDAPREGPASSVLCITKNISPPCTLNHDMVSSEGTQPTPSETSSTTIITDDADQCIPALSGPQHDGAPAMGLKAASTSLLTSTFSPSIASADTDLPQSHWRCWWSFTQTLKKVSTRMIQTTKKGKIATAD